jgi:CheY-like chemotaxis protein
MIASAAPVLLLVEDNEDDVVFMEKAFADARLACPHRVISDGLDVIHYLEGRTVYADRTRHPLPTHILLDLKLPRRSGLEILEWIRAHPELKSIRVSVLSSSKVPDDIARAQKLGIDQYLVKPVSYRDLLALVEGVCKAWQLGQRSR